MGFFNRGKAEPATDRTTEAYKDSRYMTITNGTDSIEIDTVTLAQMFFDETHCDATLMGVCARALSFDDPITREDELVGLFRRQYPFISENPRLKAIVDKVLKIRGITKVADSPLVAGLRERFSDHFRNVQGSR